MLADTSFLIDIMENDSEAIKKAKEIEDRGLTIHVGSPTIFELYVGISLSRKARKEEAKVETTIASLPQLAFDFESARVAGSIYAEKIKRDSKIDPEDAMLAGIAKIRGETILTRNTKHFENLVGLAVEAY